MSKTKEQGPECSPEEFLLRGILASELKCWHRLTEDEAQNLVAFVQNMPPKPAQQEPVAWVREHELPLAPGDAFSWVETFVHKTPLYTSPPASKPLTDEQIKDVAASVGWWVREQDILDDAIELTRVIEAAHGIKGDA